MANNVEELVLLLGASKKAGEKNNPIYLSDKLVLLKCPEKTLVQAATLTQGTMEWEEMKIF